MRRPCDGLRWFAACLAMATLVAGCGGGGGPKGPNSARLIVIDTIPIDGGQLPLTPPQGAVRSHEFHILFSANPDPETVLDRSEFNGLNANVRFIDSSLTRVPGRAFLGGLDASGRTPTEVFPEIDPTWAAEIANDAPSDLRFIYDTDGTLETVEYLPADQYTIVVNGLVTNRTGDPILEPYCGSFTSGADSYAPVVRFTSPVDGATDVSLTTDFVFEFNEQVVPSTVIGSPPATPQAVTLTAMATGGGGSLVIPGTITTSVSNTCRYTFTPSMTIPGSAGNQAIVVQAVINGPLQISDAAGNIMGGTATANFTMTEGPTISNNPIPPNALWFASTSPNAVGVVGINAIGTSANNPVTFVDTNGDNMATAADDNVVVSTSINRNVGTPVGIALGEFVGSPLLNALENIPLPNPPPPLALGNSIVCLPSACNTLCPPLTLPCPAGCITTPNNSVSDIGTFLYVADSDNNLIRVLNSNTSLEIDAIPVPDPAGVTVSQNLRNVFVSNFGSNSVSVIQVTGGTHSLLKEVNVNPNDPTLAVPRGPRSITVQPDMEDVLVLGRDDEMGVLSFAQGYEVRKVISSSIGPDAVDVDATWRGGTYFAYITNRGGDSISVFESGPNFPVNLGPDDIKIVLEGSSSFQIRQPTRMHCDLTSGLQGAGVWYVNSEDGTIGRIDLTFLGPPPSPYFPNPAPTRVWGQSTITSSLGSVRDIAMGDNLTPCFGFGIISQYKNNFGQISQPIKGYVATGSSIRVFNARTGIDMGVEIPVPGVNLLTTHFKY